MQLIRPNNCALDYTQERKWERGFLKKKCIKMGIEEDYISYNARLRNSYLGAFMVLHIVLTLLHIIVMLLTCQEHNLFYLDIVCYLIGACLMIGVLWINFNEKMVSAHSWIMHVTSIIAVVILVTIDISVNIYHGVKNFWVVGSFYDTYVILMIYMFLPIPNIIGPLLLSCTVSIIYIIYFFQFLSIKYQYDINNSNHLNYMLLNLAHYICLNLLGTYFRVIRDIVVRSSFFDRHQYIMEDIWLRSAREQEKLFLHTILPQQIAKPIQDDILNRIKDSERHRNKPEINFYRHRDHIMAVQVHPDVSILYADVVNYTHLTTTLSVKELVSLLHDLYARFDMAASQHGVQRIKFLGDCYYCVAGLIIPDPDHAKICVELGLCMVDNIREVRQLRSVTIDIRVGVHSGTVFAGVLGEAKLQYDIWGNDVMIANRLEATGLSSHIHISQRTYDMIGSLFPTFAGTAAAENDSFLLKFGISTYLIPATKSSMEVKEVHKSLSIVSSYLTVSIDDEQRKNLLDDELRNEFKNMPVGPSKSILEDLKQFCNCSGGNPIKDERHTTKLIDIYLLQFRDPRLEISFIRQPDYMLKYSVLLSWCIAICLVYLQTSYYSGNEKVCHYVNGAVLTILTVFLIITWYKKFCYWRYSDEPGVEFRIISCYIFRVADFFQMSFVARIFMYMLTITSYFFVISFMLTDCNQEEYQILHIENKLYHYEPEKNVCFHPWVLTNMMVLIIGMSLIYTHIPFMMKMIVSILEAIAYMIIMLVQYEYMFHHSVTTNPNFSAEYAHCILLVITFGSLYFMERQAEFNTKINFKWRVELIKKQHDAHLADQSITILLHNILPAHVVNVYLTSLAKHELYYEDYEMVAVMFATLKNFQLDLSNLRVLNEIITEFDRILSYYKDDYLVEKIKIVGCTYMAACGLDVRFSGFTSDRRSPQRHSDAPSNLSYLDSLPSNDYFSHHNSLAHEVLRARHSLATFSKNIASKQNEQVVFLLTTFALDLMRTLWSCNDQYKKFPIDSTMSTADMSIGISSGEVMAGVVGASQVHYDIWGNAVNMASRMDSTGLAGHIQVTEETAKILQNFGLQCDYRGMTFVKGRGLLPTYFVGITDDLWFKYINSSNIKSSSNSLRESYTSENDESDKQNK